jgi:hypothetical protein
MIFNIKIMIGSYNCIFNSEEILQAPCNEIHYDNARASCSPSCIHEISSADNNQHPKENCCASGHKLYSKNHASTSAMDEEYDSFAIR